jgi:hypothetical protein
MALFFLETADADKYPLLRTLVAVASPRIDDYVAPFCALIRSSFLRDIVAGPLADLDGQRDTLDATAEERDWRIILTEHFSLNVRVLPTFALADAPKREGSARRTIAALPNDILAGVVGEGQIRANLYESAFERDDAVFRRDHHLVRAGSRAFGPGDHFILRASHDVVDFVEVSGRVALVELALTQPRPIVWNYDAETLRAAYASSGAVDATRMEFAIELFHVFGAREAVPTLSRIAREHGHHWLRWKAVKTLLHLDLAAGSEALQLAIDDPHPHVRNAARATLANLRDAKLVA